MSPKVGETMKIRGLFRVAVVAVFLSTGLQHVVQAQAGSARKTDAKPNVIVIFTDDHGWADLSCQGQLDDIKTPNVDRLASEGVRMTAGYITAPQCAPSRAGLMSGRYQQSFGVGHNGEGPVPLDVKLFPTRLQEAGYVTGMVGKWHLQPNWACREWLAKNATKGTDGKVKFPHDKAEPYQPGQRGFSQFYHGCFSNFQANVDFDGNKLEPSRQIKTEMYRLDAQSKAAVSFIRNNKDQPFFLYLAYFAPHVPLEATEKYLKRFPGKMPERRRYALAMISAIDDGVGDILDELKKQGIDENTLIFFIADNGAPLKIHKTDLPISMKGGAWDGSLNDPWVGEKGMLTEGGIRVPFVARWKGTLPAGRVYDKPVISLDVAATAQALAGLKPTPELHGTNLMPYLTGVDKAAPHDALYWRFWNQAAVRDGQWKYLCLGDGTEYLFDLNSPEHEKKNLIKEQPAKAEGLKKKLSQWVADLKPAGLPAEPLNDQEIGWYEHYLGWKAK